MRFAAISAVIIGSMYRHLFHPTYVFGEGGGEREAILEQARNDLIQERPRRSVLLSVCPDIQMNMAKTRIGQVADDVLYVVGDMLTDDAGVSELKACARFAHTVWQATKKTKSFYHLSFQLLQRGEPEWATIDRHTS